MSSGDVSLDGRLARLSEAVDGVAAVEPETVEVGSLGRLLRGLDREMNRLRATALELTAAFERRGGPRREGHASVQGWAQSELRHDPVRARRDYELAERLEQDLPRTRQALRAGEITPEHATEIAKAAERLGAEADGLADTARTSDARSVRRAADRLAQQRHPDEASKRAQRAYRQRHVSIRPDRDANVWLEGRLHQLGGEKLLTALSPLAAPRGPDDERTTGQRWADALVELAERATRAGLPRDGGVEPQIVFVTSVAELERRAGVPTGSLAWTGPLPPAGFEELACEAGLGWLVTDSDGRPLYLGRTSRYASRDQRLGLRVRDGGCRWPRCPGRAEWAIAHHEPPFDPEGRTDITTMVLLCPVHHGMRHHGGWVLTLTPDATVIVRSPDGTITLRETAAEARARHGAHPLTDAEQSAAAAPAADACPAGAQPAPDHGVGMSERLELWSRSQTHDELNGQPRLDGGDPSGAVASEARPVYRRAWKVRIVGTGRRAPPRVQAAFATTRRTARHREPRDQEASGRRGPGA